MSGFEGLLPCPVCPGLRMRKRVVGRGGLTLDQCRRCRGVWFEHGEVERLRALPRGELADALKAPAPRPMLCHGCRAPVRRDAERCGACGWTLTLECPVCAAPMRTGERGGVRLDFCGACRGVWFDEAELAAIWTAALAATAARSPAVAAGDGVLGGVDLGDVLFHSPELVYHGVRAGAEVAGAAARGLAQAPDFLLAAGEAAGEAAGAAFSLLLEVLGGLLDGI